MIKLREADLLKFNYVKHMSGELTYGVDGTPLVILSEVKTDDAYNFDKAVKTLPHVLFNGDIGRYILPLERSNPVVSVFVDKDSNTIKHVAGSCIIDSIRTFSNRKYITSIMDDMFIFDDAEVKLVFYVEAMIGETKNEMVPIISLKNY